VTNQERRHSSIVINLAAAMLLLLASGAIAWLVLPSAWIASLNSPVTYTVALIRSWGPWGVVGSIWLMTVHSFLPFPAEIIALANGMIYGPVWGAAITWVGAMLGASIAFGLCACSAGRSPGDSCRIITGVDSLTGPTRMAVLR
jgi:uncharacterized membrane protein YdjX (TVP38/TMEM64 family)